MTQATPLTLDVRPELRAGGEPFPRIVQAVASLEPGQAFRLLATFEPIPLYAVLGRKGLGHRAIHHGEGDWEILFTSDPAVTTAQHQPRPAAESHAGDGAGWPAPKQVLDNRDLRHPNRWCESSRRWSNWPLAR